MSKYLVNLPSTEFSLRANSQVKEPELQKFWCDTDVYGKNLAKRDKQPKFVLHDGPPYASAPVVHMGTALNKVLKDIVLKHKAQCGFYTPFVPGYDTHGLPIENAVLKNVKGGRSAMTALELRKLCAEHALFNVNGQEAQFKRLGVLADWEHRYLTLHKEFEAVQVRVFGTMAEKGFLYKGLKPVNWCPNCETALAQADVEERDYTCQAPYVLFEVRNLASDHKAGSRPPVLETELDEKPAAKLPNFVPQGATVSFVAWTTTPWSLPGNVALAVNADLEYDFLATSDHGVLVVASALKDALVQAVGLEVRRVAAGVDVKSEELTEALMPETTDVDRAPVERMRVLGTVLGKELEHLTARHPWLDRDSKVVLSKHVLPTMGTGVVHIAPAFALDDYKVGRAYNLDVLCPLDSKGVLTAEAGMFQGLRFEKANLAILEHLRATGKLLPVQGGNMTPNANDTSGSGERQLADKMLNAVTHTHQYAHCGRCEKPLVMRATPQWFASVKACMETALQEVEQVTWLPESGQNRFRGMLTERDDWCVSRQRAWGVPVPVFNCTSCGHHVMTKDSAESVASVFEREGSNAWWEHDAEYFLGKEFACTKCGGKSFAKETDTLDVWFDSGVTHAAVVDRLPQLGGSPFELVLEGSDQHRGWFQSLLWTSVMLHGRAPYKTVLTHGFVLDEKGEKMSKKKGNVVNPDDVVKQHGADVLRLWVASVNYKEDMRVGKQMLERLAEDYKKLRNTARFLLGNLSDFDPATDRVPLEQLSGLDAYLLHNLNELVDGVKQHFDAYEFHKVCQLLQKFCAVDVSSLYFDVVKDKLYTHGKNSPSRRAVQTVLENVLQVLVRLLVPVTPHLAEDVFQHMPEKVRQANASDDSVLLANFPDWTAKFKNDELAATWAELLKVRSVSNKALELARAEKKLGKTQEAQVVLKFADDKLALKVRALGVELPALLMSSQTKVLTAGSGETGSAAAPAVVWAQASDDGVTATVLPADGEKCQRCWNFRTDLGKDQRFPDTCAACTTVLVCEPC